MVQMQQFMDIGMGVGIDSWLGQPDDWRINSGQ